MNAKAFAPSDKPDLTRWNRAGLSRMRYTSEAAAEFTEGLRIAHLLLHAQGQAPSDIDPPEVWRDAYSGGTFPDGQTVDQKLALLKSVFPRSRMDGIAARNATYAERLLAQYGAVLTDPSAQLSRAFARALHVLSETLDAYANEGTLRTATQTVHALHLLSLIGYRPRPAASAVMPIAYVLKPDQGRVLLPAGTALDHALPDGGPALTFEALEPVEAHPTLNGMRAKGHDQQRDPIPASQTKFVLNSLSPFSGALTGKLAVLAEDGAYEAVRVLSAMRDAASVNVERGLQTALNGHAQTARFLSAPVLTLSPRPRGSGWVHFQVAPETFPQAIVLAETESGDTSFKRVAEVRGRDVRLVDLGPKLSLSDMTWVSVEVAEAELFPIMANPGGVGPMAPGGMTAPSLDPSTIVKVYATLAANADDEDALSVSSTGYLAAFGFGWQPDYLKKGASLGTVIQLGNAVYVEDADLAEVKTHTFALFETAGGGTATTFGFAQYDASCISLTPAGGAVDPLDVTAVHLGFASDVGLDADPRSTDPLVTDDRVTVLCAAGEQDMLRPGRTLMLEDDDGADADTATISEVVSASGDEITLLLDAGLVDLSGYRKGFTTIRGNVAEFGHGKSLPARVLGSGDGAIDGQEMVIEDTQVSTRLNPGFPGGVAADIEITVDGRIWQQVAPGTPPVDDSPSYAVILQPDGFLSVVFDRRLSTGTDNTMLTRIRTGAGARGNEVPAYGVTNLKPKNRAVDRVVQPLAPQSGADAETLDTLRHEGRSTYTLFGRALGVDDFARLAETHAAVVHAHAAMVRQRLGRGGTLIRLTVAPQGGSGLDLIRADLEKMLLSASLPGTVLDIRPFTPALLAGTTTVRLYAGYTDAPVVRDELEALLEQAFGLTARPLGRALYVSEIVAVIEGHRAVDYVTVALTAPCGTAPSVTCTKASDGTVQAVVPDAVASVYLDDPTDLTLLIETSGGAGS